MFAGKTIRLSGFCLLFKKDFLQRVIGTGLPDKLTGKFQSSCFFHHFVFVFMHCNRLQMQSFFILCVFSGLVSISLFSEYVIWNSLGTKMNF